MAVGITAMLLALLFGTFIGVIAGYFKSLDGPLMRLTDLFLALPLLLVALFCLAQGGGWLPWGFLATVPCLLAGISLVHGIAGIKQWKVHWLILFYLFLVMVNPVKELVIIAAVVDSVADLRERVRGGKA